ncbi:hypothetical protein F2Q69_00010677 [Brassica cretica]|uniref:WRKY domain-containing protein n=1 Tax=Brassica cretica TaxID=69181 RepID=A0A8S9R688_BRACR|nr:hypothetical protein F2Q69_00010677 [Brassica cretica]
MTPASHLTLAGYPALVSGVFYLLLCSTFSRSKLCKGWCSGDEDVGVRWCCLNSGSVPGVFRRCPVQSYYRCTHNNCTVKKRVERLSEDCRMVITTYEGRHSHIPSDESTSPDHDCLSSF